MYLTVKEAIDISNKSQTTIHRLCQKYENTKYIKKEGNKYLIDKEFLVEKYPNSSLNNENYEKIDNFENEESIFKTLTEKNELITSLTIKNQELEKKTKELEEEIFDHHYELAEVIEANMNLNKELNSLIKPKTNFKTSYASDNTKIMICKALSITGSLMLLIAFIFMMYYFTK